jgi:hypothetical protein
LVASSPDIAIKLINADTDENVETTSQQDILQFLPDEVIARLDDESIDILRKIGREKSAFSILELLRSFLYVLYQ